MPFIVTADGSSLNAPGNTQVADQINGNVTKLGGVGLGAPFYDPSAFVPVVCPSNTPSCTTARFGNMGLNALRGPQLFNMNLGIFREFSATERIKLQFRGEALDLTNTPPLAQPNKREYAVEFHDYYRYDQQRYRSAAYGEVRHSTFILIVDFASAVIGSER
jgi:hypothetical protein